MDIKKINGNELHGSKVGDGWEQCSHPMTDEYVWLSPGERRLLNMVTGEYGPCTECGGNMNMHLGMIGQNEYSRCRECGTPFVNGEALNVG